MLIVQSEDSEVTPAKRTESVVPVAKGEKGVVIFKVQIFATSSPMYITPVNFKGLENVEEYKHGGLYKYVVGYSLKYDYASSVLLTEVRGKGYNSAFIVAFKDGKRIPVSDAIKSPDK